MTDRLAEIEEAIKRIKQSTDLFPDRDLLVKKYRKLEARLAAAMRVVEAARSKNKYAIAIINDFPNRKKHEKDWEFAEVNLIKALAAFDAHRGVKEKT